MWFCCALAFAGPIEEAVVARDMGNLAGASALLDAYTPEPEETGLWLYQRAIQAELTDQVPEAETLYRGAIELGGAVGLDAQFRLSLMLRDKGRPEDAARELDSLARSPFLEPEGRAAVTLERGIVDIDTGAARRGVRRITGALATLESGDTQHYMRARARVSLASVLCAEADRLTMRGPVWVQVGHLRRRATTLAAAEEQVAAAARLNEPEWVLEGLLHLGDSYSRFAHDLARVPAPARLSATEREIYESTLERKSAVLRAKAEHMWRSGIELATRLDWKSPRVQTLRLRLGVVG